MTSPRRKMLETFVAANPNDAFGRYGLAMDCVGANQLDAAAAQFEELLAANPQYVPAYYHYGQLLTRLSRTQDAQRILRAGMDVAKKAGDSHAFSEMEQALNDMS